MFRNTKKDLQECVEKIDTDGVNDLEAEEYDAMKRMYGLCKRFMEIVEREEVEYIEYEDGM